MDWANRLILGDRMTMMVSLACREDLVGKLQMIYMDPLAGIRFASKFPSQVGRWGVKYRRRTWHVSRSRYRRTMRQVPTHIWHTCATS